MLNYPTGIYGLPEEQPVVCEGCGCRHSHEEFTECPSCDERVVCPSCGYCHECNMKVDDMTTCECGSGEITDSDCCSQCFDDHIDPDDELEDED